MSAKRIPVARWTVEYGDNSEPKPVLVPHAWAQDIPVSCEGPVVYRAEVEVPRDNPSLLFHGVSYAAEVLLDGEPAARHLGIWDAFEVPLTRAAGKTAQVEVRVTKSGGPTYPVRDVAGGFLPYVYHTFGGIYREVELLSGEREEPPQRDCRVEVVGSHLYVEGQPFYARGLLHWGWYPEIGHPNPPEDTIRREVRAAKALGFNLVKFCLWVPPHRYLEILERENMRAWIELPIWDPTDDPAKQAQMAEEVDRIASQYAHHPSVIAWTIGCELSESTGPDFRKYLVDLVRNRTGCPLVKDNSGGAEMYGGDPREFGSFYDFHPYCDLQFYPLVLDSLARGPRAQMPTLLGEFNDADVHRDLARVGDELPYWASSMPELNEQGVRWTHELPRLVAESRFANYPTKSGHAQLMESTRSRAAFIRKTVHEWVRARPEISGSVNTGWRDTPMSSSGFFDDWGDPRFTEQECATWNGPLALFLIPQRRPPWKHGGNRPGWVDPWNRYPGQIFWKVGVHSEQTVTGGLIWRVLDSEGKVLARGAEPAVTASALEPIEVGQILWYCAEPGDYAIEVEFLGARNRWPVWVVPPGPISAGELFDPAGRLSGIELHKSGVCIATSPPADLAQRMAAGNKLLLLLTEEGCSPAPFWREAGYEWQSGWLEPFRDRWERLLPVSCDRVIDPGAFPGIELETLVNRVDLRTYAEAPIVARADGLLVTCLRPCGGLGITPEGISANPAGHELLVNLLKALER